jgi:hypothetical protein
MWQQVLLATVQDVQQAAGGMCMQLTAWGDAPDPFGGLRIQEGLHVLMNLARATGAYGLQCITGASGQSGHAHVPMHHAPSATWMACTPLGRAGSQSPRNTSVPRALAA